MNKQEISIQLYIAKNFKPYDNIFKFLSEQGFQNVELFEVEEAEKEKIYNLKTQPSQHEFF